MKAAVASPSSASGSSLSAWLLLGMLMLVLAMVIQAPASLLQKALPPGLPIQVDNWGGTLWNGQANWRQGPSQGQLSWQLRPLQLFLGRLTADLQTRGDVRLAGRASLRLGGGWALDELSGTIPASLVQPLLPAGWSMPGDFQAEQVSLARARPHKAPWQQAGGSLRWQGGPMSFSVNGQTENATLPAVVLNLRLDNDTLVLGLQEAAGSLGLATVRLGPDDMLETQLRQRLLAFGAGYHGAGSPDEVVITAKQPL